MGRVLELADRLLQFGYGPMRVRLLVQAGGASRGVVVLCHDLLL